MITGRTTFILIWALLLLRPLHAEPSNVVVGGFTFTRPAEWTWDSAPEKSKALTRFIIPDDSGTPSSTTDVRFYLGQKSPTVAAAVWKSYFPNAKEADLWDQEKKIGEHHLTYVSASGNYVYGGSKPKLNYTFFGVVIPSGKDFVHVRILGPRKEVETATTLFKKMVEDALRDKESE